MINTTIKTFTQYEVEKDQLKKIIDFHVSITKFSLRGLDQEDSDKFNKMLTKAILQTQEALKSFENKLIKPLKFKENVEAKYGWGDTKYPTGFVAHFEVCCPWETVQRTPDKSYRAAIQNAKENYKTDPYKRFIVYRTLVGPLMLPSNEETAFFGVIDNYENVIFAIGNSTYPQGKEREF